MKKINLQLKVVSILAVIILTAEISYTQVVQQWVTRYEGLAQTSQDAAHDLKIDAQGNVYVTGQSLNQSGNDYDMATIKYDNSGAQLWASRYATAGNNNDVAVSMAVDNSGNVFVAGYSDAPNGTDIIIVKYNSTGVQQWAQRVNGPANNEDKGTSVAVDGLGNAYVTGFVNLNSGNDFDIATIKFNSVGTLVWQRTYSDTAQLGEMGYSIAVDNFGNAYVTGVILAPADPNIVTIKYDSAGGVQWAKVFASPQVGNDMGKKITVDNQGNVYVAGVISTAQTSIDYAVLKYGPNGALLWNAFYTGLGTAANDEANAIAVDISGNVYVTGYSYQGNSSFNDYATIKFNSSGQQQWVQRYSGPPNMNDEAQSIAADTSGNVYVTGFSTSVNGNDYTTIKYNSAGQQEWLIRYSFFLFESDQAAAVAVDLGGNVYVTGSSFNSNSNSDYATLKYSQPIGIHQISTEAPSGFALEQNFPNPFNPSTKIRFSIPPASGIKNNKVTLKIFDMLGRQAAVLVDRNLGAGIYEAEWDGSGYSSGIYFYTLSAGSYSQTKKLTLIK